MTTQAISGLGTRTKVTTDGFFEICSSNMPFNLEPGEIELSNVSAINVSIVPDDIIRADVNIILTGFKITAEGRGCFSAPDPNDSYKEKKVTKIGFYDGSSWEQEE